MSDTEGDKQVPVDLDERLQQAVKTVIESGRFTSQREFLIAINEHFDPEHAENPMQARVDRAVEPIKQAFIDAGWRQIGVTGNVVERSVNRHEYVGANGGKNIPLMTGQEWLDKTLKAAFALQAERDYFRSQEDFRASTITMGELEDLLKKAAGPQ